MFRKKIGITLFVLFFVLNCVHATTTVFEDNFNDNDFTNNPTWTNEFSNAVVIANELHSDGLIVDESDRYVSKLSYPLIFSANDDLILTFDALLKSSGSPQIGRGVHISYYDANSDYTYLLSVTNGYTNGASYDHQSILLGFLHPSGSGNLIKTNFVPNYDTWYKVKAIRHNHSWNLYVDNILIGTENDNLNIVSFKKLILDMTGSVAIDNIKVETAPSNENDIPEFTILGIASIMGLAGIFVLLKRR
jgi:hypothetical protein